MFCRTCKHEVPEQAVVCMGCGCHPRVGTKYCYSCGSDSNANAQMCLKCGVPFYSTPAFQPNAKSRVAFVLLGALLGLLFPGIHNMYIGRVGIGVTQLLLSYLSCGVLWLPMYIWCVIDVCVITTSADGKPLQ